MSEEQSQDLDARTLTGVSGLDYLLDGGLPARRLHLIEGNPGTGKTTLALQFLHGGPRARRDLPLRRAVGDGHRAARSGGVARLVARRHRGVRAARGPTRSRPDEQSTLYHPSEIELGEMVEGGARDGRPHPPEPRRARLALGDAPAGARSAAIPAADPRPQGILRRPRLHGPDARRSHVRRQRPPAAEHRARRRPARAAAVRVRAVAPAAAHRQAPRRAADERAITTSRSSAADSSCSLSCVDAHRPDARPRQSSRAASPSSTRCSAAALTWGTTTLFIGPAGVGKSTLAAQYVTANAGDARRPCTCSTSGARRSSSAANRSACACASGWPADGCRSTRSNPASCHPASSPTGFAHASKSMAAASCWSTASTAT